MSAQPVATGRKVKALYAKCHGQILTNHLPLQVSAAKLARVDAAIAANTKRQKERAEYYKNMTPLGVKRVLEELDEGSDSEFDAMLAYARDAAKQVGAVGISSWGVDFRVKRLVITHKAGVEVKGLPKWLEDLVVFRQGP